MAKKENTYGTAMEELQQLMEEIESNQLDIDQLMSKVKKASVLIKYCKEQLTKTNEELQKVLDDIEEI